MGEALLIKAKKKVLGRGLQSLISSHPVAVAAVPSKSTEAVLLNPDNSPENLRDPYPDNSVVFVDIDLIANNQKQPRLDFDNSELNELAASIKSFGVLQPVLVRPYSGADPERYQIVAGERRWRAARLAGLNQIPVIIRDFDDKDTLAAALIENIQRANLNPIEEARGYQALIEDFALTQQQVAERVGRDRASIANFLRLLKLPPEVIEMLRSSQITMGHAKAILTVKEPAAQRSLAQKTVSENLSVRALEDIVARVVVLDAPKRGKSRTPVKSSFPEVTDKLRNYLGTKVHIRHHKSGRGKIEIQYFSEQELDRIVELLVG